MLAGMGYRGKVEERQRARELRAQSWTLQEIASELGVSKSSVSAWVRDVDFVPRPRNRGHPAGPKHPMRLRKEAELERCRIEAEEWVGEMSDAISPCSVSVCMPGRDRRPTAV